MRIGDILYFSPKYRFDQINWNDKEKLIEAFRDRVEGFYLNPARVLNEHKYAFGSGILCVTTIDFLARITNNSERVGQRIKRWLTENMPKYFDETLAQRFHEEFRNGLVHEGRIKNCGQFSYDFDELVHQENGIMVVNPNLLLEKIIDSFESYMTKVRTDNFTFQLFKCAILRDFQEDIKCAKNK